MRARIGLLSVGIILLLGGCGDDGESPAVDNSFASNQRIVYSDGLHSENTEMIRLGDRILLIFRGGETGQTGSAKAHINVFESTDDGRSFTLIGQVNANNLPGERDIRDPKLVQMGDKLFMYAISRVPGAHYRDLFGQAWTIRAESSDGGHTWTPPVKTFEDITTGGRELYWGFWRFTKRQSVVAGEQHETLYATGYNDGDTTVAFFSSEDGVTWQKLSTIINSYDDVPSEAELQFFGNNNATAVSLVRLDNQEIVTDGQTAICTSQEPFSTWECGRRIEQRLDGPTWIVRRADGQSRNFVFARKHLPCTFKRTAIYELRGDVADPNAAIEVCEIQEVKSSGDTAYTALAPITTDRYLLSWYSSRVDREIPWLEGQFEPSNIWLADVDFTRAPATCTHPAPKRLCQAAPLPASTKVYDVTGSHLLTMAPVIWPKQPISFRADVAIHGTTLDMTLQPLDAMTKLPVGDAWSATDVAIAADGSFSADFGAKAVPAETYPILDDPFLTVHDFTLTGKTISTNAFCGNVGGYAQTIGNKVSDQVRLVGSTFGATRITGDTLPSSVSACP
ncbi:MAG TPA: sialidase family protein [Candidatus Acidoferrales bacterium]|nr:sialidase family protein [Candidatus Acidoferrales bacterium]